MADPRPRVDASQDPALVGVSCTACSHPMTTPRPVCAACGGPVTEARFGPEGVIYSSTVVRIAVGDRTPPYALAYVDLDDGPRVLAHVAGDDVIVPPVASRVLLTNQSSGDVVVEVLP